MVFVLFILVVVINKYLFIVIKEWYLNGFDFNVIGFVVYIVDVVKIFVIWVVGLVLIVGIIVVIFFDFCCVYMGFKDGVNVSIGGFLFVVMNIVFEYGFGVIIVVLLGFVIISYVLGNIFINLLVNGVVIMIVLVGVIGLVFGGMSIVLSVMVD